ncbi:hypothetical protein [Streptomyces sp. NPDC050164]|uniref:hypothetical protein n=1 Tax=Streptomyces sp. NPDC050164 TaxID=3365605 RepID=UPI003787BED5
MGFKGQVWQVHSAGQEADGAVGEILIEAADFPWLSGRFTPGPAFDSVRDLFAQELALARQDHDRLWEAWERVYAEIIRRVSLSSPDGPVPAFLLHIEGDEAWFRWSDEPDEDFADTP